MDKPREDLDIQQVLSESSFKRTARDDRSTGLDKLVKERVRNARLRDACIGNPDRFITYHP